MRITRILATCCVTIATMLATMEGASAARIYNFLNIPVEVRGLIRIGDWGVVKIAPGQRSDSLAWSKETMIWVEYDIKQDAACKFNTFPHAEIQGGNYVVVSQRGQAVSCVICNASHNEMYSASGSLPSYVPPYTSSHHGC